MIGQVVADFEGRSIKVEFERVAIKIGKQAVFCAG